MWRAGQKGKDAKTKVSGATVNRNLTTLKRIYNYADAMGLNVRNPVSHAARKQKIDATAKLQAIVEAARQAEAVATSGRSRGLETEGG